MEVEYVVKAPDLMAFQKYHQARRQKPGWRARLVGWAVALMLAFGALLLQYLDLVPLLYSIGCLFFGALICFLAMHVLMRWASKAELKQRASQALGWRRLSITSEGIALATETSRHEMKWVMVRKVARDEGYAFLYLTDVYAIILPRRPFVSDEDFEQFVATARRYRRAARETTVPGGAPHRDEAARTDTNIAPDQRAER